MMLTIRDLTYSHSNKKVLFANLSMTVSQSDKIGLIGNNGVGKSTLLKIIAGEIHADEGQIITDARPYYIPQVFGQFNQLTVAQALLVDLKLNALYEILKGNTADKNFDVLGDDWTIEDHCREALDYWKLSDLNLSRKLSELSGGQKTKIFLAGVQIHQPAFILLDEPSNHLDEPGRELLCDFSNPQNPLLLL